MSVISHILSITAPLSHTCTTYRPVVLIKKTTDISSGKMNKRLVSHFRPQGERVQMNEWSVSSLSNHLCNVTSLVCAHLCQQRRLFQNVRQRLFLPTTLSPTLPHFLCLSPPHPHPLSSSSVPSLPILCRGTLCDRLYSVSPAGDFDT